MLHRKKENFIIFIQNEGGCDAAVSETALQSLLDALPSKKYSILRTKATNAGGLSNDLLQPVLNHLMQKLPEMDHELILSLTSESAIFQGELKALIKHLHHIKTSSDAGYSEELYEDKADEYRDTFADLCKHYEDYIQEDLAKTASNKIISIIRQTQEKLSIYFENGFGEDSLDIWINKTARKTHTRNGVWGIFEDNGNAIRVTISEEFNKLNDVYQDIIDETLQTVASIFEEVFPVFLHRITGRENLEYLKQRIEEQDVSMHTFTDALDTLLALSLDHRTQFYPRAYEPIMDFRKFVRNPTLPSTEGESSENLVRIIHEQLRDIAERTVTDMVDALILETSKIKDLIFVSFEYFEDCILRSQKAERQWRRLIRTFYPEIWGNTDPQGAIIVHEILMKLRELENLLDH